MKSNFSLRYFLSLLCFLLSGAILYNPLYRASRPLLVSVGAVILGLLLDFAFTSFYKKRSRRRIAEKTHTRLLCVFSFVVLCFACVFYLEQMRSAFSFFSDFYGERALGMLFTVLLLFVCAYAGHRKSEGVYRLCQLVCPMFVFFYVMLFFAIPTTKGLILPSERELFGINAGGVVQLLFSGLYLFSDIAVFHFVFEGERQGHLGHFPAKESFLSCVLFGCVMLLNRMRASFMFGETLTANFSFCDLASIMLLPHFSFPELFLLFTVFACIIKVSVYISAAAKLLGMLCKTQNVLGFKSDTYISALFTFLFSLLLERLIENSSYKNVFFMCGVLLSSFLTVLVTFFSSKHQNKTL